MKRIDYDNFGGYLAGPDGGRPRPECNCVEPDGDQDADLSDIRQFQQAFVDG